MLSTQTSYEVYLPLPPLLLEKEKKNRKRERTSSGAGVFTALTGTLSDPSVVDVCMVVILACLNVFTTSITAAFLLPDFS